MVHSSPPRRRFQNFLEAMSFSAALSSIAAASGFFSFRFSFSRDRSLETAVPAPPVVQCRLADPVLSAQVRRLRSRAVQTQNLDNLFFAEPLPFHRSFSLERTQPSPVRVSGEQVTLVARKALRVGLVL